MSDSEPRWEVSLTRQAEKMLHRLPKNLLRRLDQAILALGANPRPSESQALPGHHNLYRLPINGWRIAYAIEEERRLVLILEIASKQQPERYQLEEELDEVSLPQETKDRNELFAKANLPDFLGQLPETNFLDAESFKLVTDFMKHTRQEKIRLLIVDDLAETRENLHKLLNFEADIEIVGIAASGEEAVQMAVEQQPDVVLMDIMMPGINGFAATEMISQQVPSAQVIMMSVRGEADFLRQAMLAGAKEFLIKPFSADELMTSIRRVYKSFILKPPITAATPYVRDAFKELKERIQARLLADLDPTIDISRPNELGRTILGERFEQILAQENMILSRSERERLFESIVAEILETELDETQKRVLGQWFKFFKLGNNVEISLSVADLSESLSFYKKFDLEKVDSGEKPYPWAVVSDGRFYLGLHQREFSSPTLSYFSLGIIERMIHLPKLGVRLDNVQKLDLIQGMQHNQLLGRQKFMTAEFRSPEGQRVLLADLSSDVETTPTGRKFFTKYENFGELSLSTLDVNAALAYWEKLGFEGVTRGDQPYPWAVICDGRIRLGLHQTPKFTKPAITYFAPDMPDRLKRLRRRGIQFLTEYKDKRRRRIGAMIESPDGQHFFLFTGEIRSPKRNEAKAAKTTEGYKPEPKAWTAEKKHLPSSAVRWYKIYTYEGYERKLQKNLLQRVEAMGMQDKILQVTIPPIGSGPVIFPSYILIEMILDDDSWYVVGNTPGVTGFFGSGNKPMPLLAVEVNKLLGRAG